MNAREKRMLFQAVFAWSFFVATVVLAWAYSLLLPAPLGADNVAALLLGGLLLMGALLLARWVSEAIDDHLD